MKGKTHSDETKRKISETKKLNMNDEVRKRISNAQKKKVKCPICSKVCGSLASAKRYHFDNCKDVA